MKKIRMISAFMISIFGLMYLSATIVFATDATKSSEKTTIKPALVASNGATSIDIPSYDPAAGWVPGVVKNARISVDFGAAAAPNKILKIKLPEGMRFVSYPMKGANASKGEIEAPGSLASVISSNTGSQKHAYAPSYTGELVYQFVSGTEKTDEIVIGITVDESLYYGPKVFTGANTINVSASVDGTEVGNTSMDVNAVNNGSMDFNTYGTPTASPNYKNVLGSTNDVISTNAYMARLGFLFPLEYYAKSFNVRYYYPVGSKVTAVKKANTTDTYTVNDAEGYVEFVSQNTRTGKSYGVTLDTSKLPLGINQNIKKTPIITAVSYDDKTIETISYVNSPIIEIIDKAPSTLMLQSYAHSFSDISSDYQSINTFAIENDAMSIKKNQVLEINVGDNYDVNQVVLPYGIISNIKYKTNLNNTLRSVDLNTLEIDSGTNGLIIDNKKIGLAENEFFTFVTADLKDVPLNYNSRNVDVNSIRYLLSNARVIGRLSSGVNTENINIRTYEKDGDNNPINDSISSTTLKVNRVGNLAVGLKKLADNVTVLSGKSYSGVSLSLSTNGYAYNNSIGMLNPKILLKVPDGVTYHKDSFKIYASGKSLLPNDYNISDQYTVANGDKYIEIDIKHRYGAYFDGMAYTAISIKFDLSTTLFASGNYKWSNIAFLTDGSNKVNGGTYSGEINPVADSNDIDRDGNKTELLMPFSATNFIISPDRNLLIDTYIKPSASSPRETTFDVSKPKTAINFTPGTNAIYNVEVYNNRDEKVAGTKSNLTAYIPVPKDNMDFGTDLQSKPFNWNMKLSSSVIPVIKVYNVDPATGVETDVTASKAANYKLTYSTDASDSSNYKTATYSNTMSENTTMIQLTNTNGIDMQEKAKIEFVYIVDETPSSVQSTDKLGSINDFMPFYRYQSGGTAGTLNGSRVGANLVIGEISGKVFKDLDSSGTVTSGDTNIPGIVVTLFKKDATNKYVPYIDSDTGVQMKATTAADGSYKFINLPNGDFKIDFSSVVTSGGVFTPANTGTDYKIDSDVIQNGTGVGTGINIDPTQDSSKYIYAGLLAYNPPVDLKLTADKSSVNVKTGVDGVGVGTSESATLSINPKFFATISDKTYDTDGIKWVSSDDTIATVSGNGVLTNNSSSGVSTDISITGIKVGTAIISATIQDQYGQNREVKINVNVTANTKPTISVGDTFVEFNSTFDSHAVVSANDAEDGSIVKSKIKVTGTVDTSISGPQTVSYEIKDNDGNITVKDVVYFVGNKKTGNVVFYAESFSITETQATTISESDIITKAKAKAWSTVDQSVLSVTAPNFLTELKNKPAGVYDVTLSAGSQTSVIKVTVTDSTKPVITTNKDVQELKINKVSGTISNDYIKTLFNAQATDNVVKNINQADIQVIGSVNGSKIGTNKITFKYTDTSGNFIEKEVTLNIVGIIISGIVFDDINYDNKNITETGIEGVSIDLVNDTTNEVLATVVSNSQGKYSFTIPIASEDLTTSYVVVPGKKIGYTLADLDTSVNGSRINFSTNQSEVFNITGVDYTNINIGMAKAITASIAPDITRVYVNDTVTNSINLSNGTIASESLDNKNSSIIAVAGGYKITGLIPGVSTLTVNFLDGYKRVSLSKETKINIIPLPTISTSDKILKVLDSALVNPTKDPSDGIIQYKSAVSNIASVDNNGLIKANKRGTSVIESNIVTNDKEAKKAQSKSLVSVGLEKYPTVSANDAIDSVDFTIKKSKLKNISLAGLIAAGNAAAWSVNEQTLNESVVITNAQLSDKKPVIKTSSNTKTTSNKNTYKYVTYTSKFGTKAVSKVTIINDDIDLPTSGSSYLLVIGFSITITTILSYALVIKRKNY